MYKKITLVLILGMVLMLAACTGEGISGSASGHGQKHFANDSGGTVEGDFNRIKGTYSSEYEISIFNDDFVNVDITVSVETGRLRVYLKDEDGDISDLVLNPGETGRLTGKAEVWFDESFNVYFEALDEEAEGITYSMVYTFE